uniref:Uncharacterized protein n=1 Tax=Zea mays TaxID=4577 RepID=A0A804RBB8_MAIZE
MADLLGDPAWPQLHPRLCTDTPRSGLQCELAPDDARVLRATYLHLGPDVATSAYRPGARLDPASLRGLPHLRMLSIFGCFGVAQAPVELPPALFPGGDTPASELAGAELAAIFRVMADLLGDPAWSQLHPRLCTDTPRSALQCELAPDDARVLRATRLHLGPDVTTLACRPGARFDPASLRGLPHFRTLSIFGCFDAAHAPIEPPPVLFPGGDAPAPELAGAELTAFFRVMADLLGDPAWLQLNLRLCTDTPRPGLQCELAPDDARVLRATRLHLGPDVATLPCRPGARLYLASLRGLPHLQTLSIFGCFGAAQAPIELPLALFPGGDAPALELAAIFQCELAPDAARVLRATRLHLGPDIATPPCRPGARLDPTSLCGLPHLRTLSIFGCFGAAQAPVEVPPSLFTSSSSLEHIVLKSNPSLTSHIPATLVIIVFRKMAY